MIAEQLGREVELDPMGGFQLVDPEFLAECLSKPELSGNLSLLEAHFSSPDHPSVRENSQHIPGALQVHPSYLEAGTNRSKYYPSYGHPSDGNLLPDRELGHALQCLGITPETPVLVYGTEPDGTMAAARIVWALLYAGVARVWLLDGGLEAWLAYGGETVSHIETATEMAKVGGPVPATSPPWLVRRELLATTAEVYEVSKSSRATGSKLVDVRGAGEWDGTQTHHYTFFSKAGHIPSAEYQGDWDNLVDAGTDKLAPMLEAVAQRWRELGILDPQVEAGRTTLIFYCGTGWRSSIALLVALRLGLRAKNYDDGFYGWSWSGENEIAVGTRH